ncbi:MAG: DUF3429 domain-containing protein [Arenimonas sp.]|nr:DUF3429 domain-containing protein [Arenimonas sp.]MBP7917185.1 DUF3429 domain-containing protein [Arenimonas sp.]
MNTNQQKLATLLTYAGLLPMVLALVNRFLHVVPIDSVFWAASYAAVIASFICGIHWAVFLFFAGRSPLNLLLTSNLICLSAWLALLIPAELPALAILMLCFISLLSIDRRLCNEGLLPAWFYKLRQQASIGMMLCLAAFFAAGL